MSPPNPSAGPGQGGPVQLDRYRLLIHVAKLDVTLFWGIHGRRRPDPSLHLWWGNEGLHLWARRSRFLDTRAVREHCTIESEVQ